MSEISWDPNSLNLGYPVLLRDAYDASDLRYFDGRTSAYVDMYYGNKVVGEEREKYIEATASGRADLACAAWAPDKRVGSAGNADTIALVRGAATARHIVEMAVRPHATAGYSRHVHLPILDELTEKIAERTNLELLSWLSDVAGVRMQLAAADIKGPIFQVNNILVERQLQAAGGDIQRPVGINYLFSQRAGN